MESYVTADDFGLNTKANKEILKLALEKKIDFISLLVNMETTKEAVLLYKKSKLDNLGLHFNLVEGKPLSDRKLVPTLVDKKGIFHILPLFLTRLFFMKISLEEVRTELKAQLNFFKKNNLSCRHINSHQNVHVFSPIDRIVSQVAEEYRIEYVRKPSSVVRRLRKFLLKIVVYYIIYLFLKLRYRPWQLYITKKHFEEIICHPGTNFD